MNDKYLEQIPKWYTSEDTQFDLILSDDIDSLTSCAVINQAKHWNIEYFYNFNSMGTTNNGVNEMVGVDIARCSGKTFDNHVVMFHIDDEFNPESINPNIIKNITRYNYSYKYCGSTALLVWSLYNRPLPVSEEGKMILLAIDYTHKGFYSSNSTFNDMNKRYLCDMFGFEELYEVEQRHKSYEFDDIAKKYNLYQKINHPKGILTTSLKLDAISEQLELKIELPTNTFYEHSNYKNNMVGLYQGSRGKLKRKDCIDNPYSLALTHADTVNFSIAV